MWSEKLGMKFDKLDFQSKDEALLLTQQSFEFRITRIFFFKDTWCSKDGLIFNSFILQLSYPSINFLKSFNCSISFFGIPLSSLLRNLALRNSYLLSIFTKFRIVRRSVKLLTTTA